jgi:Fe2+ transport system protein FeoA
MDQSQEKKKVLKPLRRSDKKLPLAQVHETEWYHVMSVQCERERIDELEGLGVIPGSKLKVLHNDHKGTLMVKVEQDMVILGRHYSYRTFVAPVRDKKAQS